MSANEPTAHSAAEDLSDRSNSSNSESQLHAFKEYGKIKELNLSLNKVKESQPNKSKEFSFNLEGGRRHGISFGSLAAERLTKDLSVALDKPKEFDFQPEKIKDLSSYSLDRSEDTDASLDTTKEYTQNLSRPKECKDVIYSFDGIKDIHFPRESRDGRTKNIHFPLERSKDMNFQKAYSNPPDRIKDFNFALDRMRDTHVGGLALERLRGGSFLDAADYRSSQIQPRDELEAMAIERMRRSHILTSDITPRNLPALLPHQHSITEMQHSQQQQQLQGKSFTIDSILGLRNNQREKSQRSQQHPYRRHQGQETSAKNGSSGSSSVNCGKLKRVRTIFTAEQLERLEGEFARQQYMVGPERLYLAHALKLTEAQVKVWFQNRRIKWRKLHHEQQSQRLHELHSHFSPEQEVEDSNENTDCQDAFKPDCPRALFGQNFHGEVENNRASNTRLKAVVSNPSETLDTISEHTEPSPVPSTTMDQVDLDAQSPTNKLRSGRHAASYWPPWASRVPADGTGASDSYWKANPRATHSVPHGHEQRRQEYGATEPVTSCYSASNTYRPKHRTQTPVPSKPPHVATSDQTYRVSQHSSRTARNKLLTTNNVAVVRKPFYKDEPEEYEETKYGETGINYAEENADEDAADDVDEDQEEAFEFNEKDYEEQEADDEVDDESDAFQAQLHRVQQKVVQKAPTLRTQHQRHAEHHCDFRKAQHQQSPVKKMYPDQKQSKFYSRDLEPQQPIIANDTSYGDAADTITDEDRTPPLTPTRRSSSRRTSEIHHGIPPWISARKSLDRNRDRVASPMVPAQHQHWQNHHQHQHQQNQQIRRTRMAKPEIESLMMPAHQSNATTRKCYICRGSTAPITAKVGSSTKGNCRLQEYRAFTIKGPRGEDGEAEEQIVCPHCARRFNLLDNFRTGCEPATHEASPSPYVGRPHRSQTHRSSAYNDYTENNFTVDEMLAPYTSGQPRSSTTDCPVPHRERTRHSMQSAKSPFRGESYYER